MSKDFPETRKSFRKAIDFSKACGMYISKGAIIAGVTAVGIKYEVDGPNVWPAISKELPFTDEINEIAMAMRKSAA